MKVILAHGAVVYNMPVPAGTVTLTQAALPQPTAPLAILLSRDPSPPSAGVRVTGRISGKDNGSIYISGVPGLSFSDGTFEFLGVPPGRHSIAARSPKTGQAFGTAVIVGDRDVNGIELEPATVLPLGIQTPAPPGPVGTHATGSRIPFVPLSGKVVDSKTKQAVRTGRVFLEGGFSGASLDLNEDGSFKFGPLLPGRYNMEVNFFEHQTYKQTVVVGDDGAKLEIEAIKKP
jgi:hypothetical protein